MNEELKIIISAVTDTAKKNIGEVKKQLGDVGKESGKSGGKAAGAFKAIGAAAGACVVAVLAVVAAIVSLSKNTREFRQEQAKLNTAFSAMGSNAQQASKTYSDLFRFMGESDTATEAAGHLAKLTTEEKALAEWTTALQGVYATFGDSIPIEGLTEAANETAKVGKVTGTLADALNWAGVSEDEFNASLAACNNEAEREKLIRDTLNGLYSDAAQLYEKNNAEIIAQNEAQARLDMTLARLGKTAQPLETALTNLSNTLLTALAPAIEIVAKALTWLINALSTAIGWVANFFSALTGKSLDVGTIEDVGTNIGGAATGAGNLGSNLEDANKQAEKLKRTTAGFDELNILSNQSSGGGSGGGGSGGGGSGGIGGGTVIETGGIIGALDGTSDKVNAFAEKVKAAFKKLQEVFAPTINAFKDLGMAVADAFKTALPDFESGANGILGGLQNIFSYIFEKFIPNITNSVSTNLVPVFSDVLSFAIKEVGKDFEMLGGLFESVSNEIIIPVLQGLETVVNDVTAGIKKAWDKNGGELLTNIQTFLAGVREDILEFYNNVILPIWEKLKGVFKKVWNEGLKPLWDEVVLAANEIGACLLKLYNEFIKPIVDWLQEKIYPIIVKVINWIVEKVGNAIITIANVIQGIIKVIKGIIQFITGAFTGDWKKAWEGVKNIFGGIWDSLVAVIKVPLNLIIGAINALLNGITKGVNTAIKAINKLSFTVPDWVPEFGGKKFGFNIKELTAPQIPKLATGGIVMSETLARIGEGGKKEAVLPLEQNTEWMDNLADKIASRNNTPTKIVLMLNETELGWANIKSINGITKQTGQLQLSIV